MSLHTKPEAIKLIEKNFKINEIENAADKNYIGANKYVVNENNQLIELVLVNFKGTGMMRLGKLPHLKRLVFQDSSLRDLTALRSICPNLEVLEINDDKLLENISGLKFLKKLKYLQIKRTKVWDLSPLYEIMQNGTLEILITDGTPLRYPPSELVETSSISAVKQWFEETWEQPRRLIDEAYKTQSSILDLGNCGITDLSHFPQLFECAHLETLILSNEWPYYKDGEWQLIKSKNTLGVKNNLFYIPNKFSRLSKLKELYISGDWKTRQKDGFWNRGRLQHFQIFRKLPNLEYLNISNQQIKGIVDLEKLPHLRVVHLNNNRIQSIRILTILPSLELLFLSNNLLKDVTFLNFCPNATTVDLHQNRLRNLLPIRNLIAKIGVSDTKWSIGTISLAKNTTLRLPKYETIADGTQNVLDYFDRWEKEQEADLPMYENTDLKIILVGNSSVGKTTLAHWLTTGQVNLELKSTHWLNKVPWKTNFGRRTYSFHIFDFGGQEYYHDTHHLFFTMDAVYLLLWDKNPYSFDEIIAENSDKKELIQTFPLNYWLDSIRFFADKRQLGNDEIQINDLIDRISDQTVDSQPLLMEDHADDDVLATSVQKDTLVLQSKADGHGNIEFLNQQNLLDQHPRIYDFANFSLSKGRNLIYIKELLAELVRTMPLINQPILGSWGAIKVRIENAANKYKKDMSIKVFQRYCNDIIRDLPEMIDAGKPKLTRILFNETDTRNFAQYLSKIGLLLYFPEHSLLKDRVFPNQNHLLGQIHNALKAFAQGWGIATKTNINAYFKPHLKAKQLNMLIEVMIHFKIVFQHPADDTSLIAPLYLPKKPVKAIQIFLPQFKKPEFRYIFKAFIHRNVVLEFFATFGKQTLHEYSKTSTYYFWRDGLVIKDEINHDVVLVQFNNNAEVENRKEARIDVFSLGHNRGDFLKKIVLELDRITFDRQVEKCVSLNGTDFIPLKEIENAELKDHYIFNYRGIYYKLVDFKEHLKKPDQMKNIFISYSKDDLPMVNNFIKHLAALQRDGIVGHWYCTELLAGEEWDLVIQDHFKKSDIICFMISPNFMKTEYIYQYEIKHALDRKAIDPSYRIVPIVMDFCRWQTKEYNLGKYTALPYTTKPIADFDNKNAAWYIVQEAIRAMIDDENAPSGDDFYKFQKLPKDVLEIYERIVSKQRI